MTDQQIYNMKWKLPELLFSFIKSGRTDEILECMVISESELVDMLSAKSFPSDQRLKWFCDHFKMRYSTLRTWNVLHLENASKY